MSTTTIEMLNKIRMEASLEYQNRIPEATRENLKDMGKLIVELGGQTKEEFFNLIVDKVAMTKIKQTLFSNPLKPFKKGTMPYGKTIETVFVPVSKSKGAFDNGNTTDYPDGTSNADMIFSKEDKQLKIEYISKERRDMYKATISDDQLITAFTSGNPIGELTNAILTQMQVGAELDEYVIMKELLASAIAETTTPISTCEVEPIEDNENNAKACKDFVKTVRKMSKSMSYMSDKYNAQKVKTATPVRKQTLIINSDVLTEVDVEALWKAFHEGSTNVKVDIVEVDDFGSANGVYAMLVDIDYIQIYDRLNKTKSVENPVSLYTNVFLHIWQVYGLYHCANAIVFKPKVTPAV